jgi:hypothetical protein
MGNLRIFHNGNISTNSKPYFAEAMPYRTGTRAPTVGQACALAQIYREQTQHEAKLPAPQR